MVEIGTVELINRSPAKLFTATYVRNYLCPQRDIRADAPAVHGLSAEFLAGKPLFVGLADEFLAFAGDAPLVGGKTSRT